MKKTKNLKIYNKKYQKEYYSTREYAHIYKTALGRLRIEIDRIKRTPDIITVFKLHMEKQFNEHMNWNNYGTYWNIDHIISGTRLAKEGYSIEEINQLDNIRPLEIKINQKRKRLL